eukprot:scaffold213255_cov30-Tisochrysis_lutea.AAC.1
MWIERTGHHDVWNRVELHAVRLGLPGLPLGAVSELACLELGVDPLLSALEHNEADGQRALACEVNGEGASSRWLHKELRSPTTPAHSNTWPQSSLRDRGPAVGGEGGRESLPHLYAPILVL